MADVEADAAAEACGNSGAGEVQRWLARTSQTSSSNEGLASEKEAEAMDEEMRPDDAGRAGLPMVDLEHPRALG